METNVPKDDRLNARRRLAYQRNLLLALGLSIGLNIFALLLLKWIFPFSPVALRTIITANEYRPSWILTLAETPESARRDKPPTHADHVSDKNAVAQNPTAPDNLPLGEPFATGSLEHADTGPRPELTPGRAENTKPQQADDDEVPARIETFRPQDGVGSNFRREFLTDASDNHSSSPFASRFEPGLANLRSRAPDLGNISLNTYAWEYAPYLLWLRNRVQRNIYPPPAFTHMGIISGRTVLRFRINRDGTLQGLKLLGYEGHKSLMETSVRAVQLSAPFRTLPQDFPEDFLEVTAQFEYTVRK